jgi:nucleoside permease NupC
VTLSLKIAFSLLREQGNLLVSLLAMMISTGLVDFSTIYSVTFHESSMKTCQDYQTCSVKRTSIMCGTFYNLMTASLNRRRCCASGTPISFSFSKAAF